MIPTGTPQNEPNCTLVFLENPEYRDGEWFHWFAVLMVGAQFALHANGLCALRILALE